MKTENKSNRLNKAKLPRIISASQAAAIIPSGATVSLMGAGGGIGEPTRIIEALAQHHSETATPENLTIYTTTGLGNRAERGISPLARPGLCTRTICSHWGQSPRMAELAESNAIEAYGLPMGVMTQLLRAAAAGQPGILSHIGLGTFVDPRQTGGRLNARTTEELVQLTEIAGKEWLFYPVIPIDVAVIRGTTADTEGYISMEDEVAFLDALPMAQAAHRNGGIVIVQVQRVVKAGSLHPKTVKIPGFLVDHIVVDPDQSQLYAGNVSRFISGDYIEDTGEAEILPLNERKLIGRRALFELAPGNVGNVGVGISDGIGTISREEGVQDEFTLTVELGPVGGVSAQGIYFGASVNMRALLDMPSQFDFYDGGGLDVTFVSFAEIDGHGNVNVSRFNGRIMGVGGFIDITQNTRKVVFSGTLTAGGLKTTIADGAIHILNEGRHRKFVADVEEISFNGQDALRRGQEVLFITERAVFGLTPTGLELREIAPGMDVERDVLAHMAFRPAIATNLKTMDARLFAPGPMGIRQEWFA